MATNAYQTHAVNVGARTWTTYYQVGLLSFTEYMAGLQGYRANRFRIVWARRIARAGISPLLAGCFMVATAALIIAAMFGIDFGGPIR